MKSSKTMGQFPEASLGKSTTIHVCTCTVATCSLQLPYVCVTVHVHVQYITACYMYLTYTCMYMYALQAPLWVRLRPLAPPPATLPLCLSGTSGHPPESPRRSPLEHQRPPVDIMLLGIHLPDMRLIHQIWGYQSKGEVVS